MNLPLFISLRYLFAKKSHNVVNLVSYISLTGVTLGTAALIVVMSVFNGFEQLTASLYGTFDPPLKVVPSEGKTFAVDSLQILEIARLPGVQSVAVTLEENVLIKYNDRQALATMKGVDSVYERLTPLHDAMFGGTFALHYEGQPTAVAGYDISAKLGMFSLRFEEPMLFYVPRRGAKVSIANPGEALDVMPVYPAGIFAVEQSFDSKYVFVPLDFAEQLLDYSNRASALEIITDSPSAAETLKPKVQRITGNETMVKTRYEQNAALYRMMKSEKAAIYLIVLFVTVILSFNVLSSLLLLIIEKKKDLATLRSLGAPAKLSRRIFVAEGMLISLSGMLAGVLLGTALSLLQQHFGLVKLPGGSFIIDAYPVQVQWTDVLIVILSVSLIGYLASRIATAGIKTRIED